VEKMNEDTHHWVNDETDRAGGVERCGRRGCTIRRATIGGIWQRKKRAPWRSKSREPMPTCTGEGA